MKKTTSYEELESTGLFLNEEKSEFCMNQIGFEFLLFIQKMSKQLQITNDECFTLFYHMYNELMEKNNFGN